jgi:hypothetical protein
VQIPAAGAAIVALFSFPPTGPFLRELPLRQGTELVRLMRRGASRDDRLEYRLGPDHAFMRFMREKTPEDAVILMSDQYAPSSLNPLRAKHQLWATYFLYPRRVLYLHQQELPQFEKGSWLVVDGEAAVSWIDPAFGVPHQPGYTGCVPFDMSAYLAAVRDGRVPEDRLPPKEPIRQRRRARLATEVEE